MKNYKVENLTKEEWLERKKTTIGGSEASAVCNKSKWLTPNDLYNKMVLGKVKKVKLNARMQEGTLAESLIRNLFALDDKRYVVKNPPKTKQWFFTRKDKPYLSCTPDGLANEVGNGRKWGIEIKDVELRSKGEKDLWEYNQLPDQYYYQVLQYLVVINDLDGVILIAHLKYFTLDEETHKWVFDYAVDRPYYILREDIKSHIDYLEKKETEFYEVNIKGRTRPKNIISIEI